MLSFVRGLLKVSPAALVARLPLLVFASFLLALPHYPSQDGPAHLSSATALLALLGGDPQVKAIFEIQSGLLTNWLTLLCQTLGLALGLGPSLTEKLLVLFVAALWVEVFVACARRLGRPSWSTFLVLPILSSVPMHLGFWNFLAAGACGLLAWLVRRDGRLGWRGHLLTWVAFLAHPFGPLLTLAFSTLEDLWARRPRRLLPLLPLALALVLTMGSDGGARPEFTRPDWPDLSGAILTVSLETWRLEHLLRIGGVVLILVGVVWSRRDFIETFSPYGFALTLGSAGLLALSALAPSALGEGLMVRERFAFLFWACFLACVPFVADRSPKGLRFHGVCTVLLFCLSTLPQAVVDWRLAAAQRTLLDRLPNLEPGLFMATVYSTGPADGAFLRFTGAPDLHLGDRYFAEQAAINPYSYQARSSVFPLRARFQPQFGLLWAFEHDANQLPFEPLAGALDGLLLVGLPREFARTTAQRIADHWQILPAGERGVLLRTKKSLAPAQHRIWPLEKGQKPASLLLRPELRGRVAVQGAPVHAHWAWRALFVRSDGSFIEDPPKGVIEPLIGVFDESARTEVLILGPSPEGLRLGLAVE